MDQCISLSVLTCTLIHLHRQHSCAFLSRSSASLRRQSSEVNKNNIVDAIFVLSVDAVYKDPISFLGMSNLYYIRFQLTDRDIQSPINWISFRPFGLLLNEVKGLLVFPTLFPMRHQDHILIRLKIIHRYSHSLKVQILSLRIMLRSFSYESTYLWSQGLKEEKIMKMYYFWNIWPL